MPRAGTSAVALHVEAARRLLGELEEQAEAALDALGRQSGDEFLSSVAGRDQILAQLNGVVDELSHQRGSEGPSASKDDLETAQYVAEIANAVAIALKSNENLAAQARRERDRLAGALRQTARPDGVATQYAATSKLRTQSLSVTG